MGQKHVLCMQTVLCAAVGKPCYQCGLQTRTVHNSTQLCTNTYCAQLYPTLYKHVLCTTLPNSVQTRTVHNSNQLCTNTYCAQLYPTLYTCSICMYSCSLKFILKCILSNVFTVYRMWCTAIISKARNKNCRR